MSLDYCPVVLSVDTIECCFLNLQEGSICYSSLTKPTTCMKVSNAQSKRKSISQGHSHTKQKSRQADIYRSRLAQAPRKGSHMDAYPQHLMLHEGLL